MKKKINLIEVKCNVNRCSEVIPIKFSGTDSSGFKLPSGLFIGPVHHKKPWNILIGANGCADNPVLYAST